MWLSRGKEGMIYLWAYLAAGVVVSVWLYVAKFMDGPDPSWVDILAQPNPDAPPPVKPTLAKRIGAQLFRYAVAITIWPLIVLILLEDKLNIGPGAPVRERVFAVKRADLLEKLTAEQIEARERVQDPLGAVPDLPFGHLNAAWKVFLAGCQPGDKLWSFSARWPGDWRGEERREGYVRVRLTGPGPAFETVRRSLAEPDGGMPKAQEPLPQTRRWPWWQRKLGPY
jgi:hypothetical protein